MDSSKKTFWTETLPDPLPENPLSVAAEWLAQAQRDAVQPNPNSMVLATVDGRGYPSARVVLCKDIVPDEGHLLFYTNYTSRKGIDLQKNPRAAVVFHWDTLHRQVRAEGRVEMLADAENDAYFRTRTWQKQLGAWASQQSQPVESRIALKAAVAGQAQRFGIPYQGPGTPEPDNISTQIPRPSNWGGYRLVVDAVELWVEGEYRIHDRARWTRSLPTPGAVRDRWSASRLQP